MPVVTTLKDASNNLASYLAGSSAQFTFSLKDFAGTKLTEANLDTIVMDLFDRESATVINSREDSDVKDTGGGYVAADGTLTLKLFPADMAFVGSGGAGSKELHVVRLLWTWDDSDGDTQTGQEEFLFEVVQIADPT